MFFSRAVVAALAFSGLSALAAPTPVEVEIEVEPRQDVAAVLGVIGTLGQTVDAILPQLDVLVTDAVVTVESATPLIQEIVKTLNDATASLNVLPAVESVTDDLKDEVANAISAVYIKIDNTITGLTVIEPAIGGLVESLGLKDALAHTLYGLQHVVAGVLDLVNHLLKGLGLGPLLQGLGPLLGGLLGGLGL